MDPKQQGYFFTKIMSTVPLFNGSVPFSACRVNSPLVCVALVSFLRAQEAREGIK